MRMVALVSVAALSLVAAASAGGSAARPRTLALATQVRELAASGQRAAVLLGPRRACSPRVWSAASGRLQRPRGSGCPGSPRDATRGIALAGTRVAWVQEDGGNLLENLLLAQTPSMRRPQVVSFVDSGPDVDGDYIGEVASDGRTFFFTVYRRCAETDGAQSAQPAVLACPPGVAGGTVVDTQAWQYDPAARGSRCPGESQLTACRRVAEAAARLTLLDADAGRIAVRVPGGPLEVLRADGSLVSAAAVGSAVVDARLTGTRLVVGSRAGGGALRVFDVRTGALVRTFSSASGRLADADAALAVLVRTGRVDLLRLTDGSRRSLPAPGMTPRAALTARGLFYTWRAARGSARERLAFLPRSAVERRFG